MEDLTFGEQVKIILGRKGMTIKQLAELIEIKTGRKMSRQNLTQRLGRDNFQEQDMRMIADILECPFRLSILGGEISSQAKSVPASEKSPSQTERHRQIQNHTETETRGERPAQPEQKEQRSTESAAAETVGPDERDMTIGELYDIHQELSEMEESIKAGEPAEKAKEELARKKKERFRPGGIFLRRKHTEEETPGAQPEEGIQEKDLESPSQEENTLSPGHEKEDTGEFEPVIPREDTEEDTTVGEINPYTGREYQSNSVRMHPTRIGYVQVYDRSIHKWTDMTEWAFLGYQERKKTLLGNAYEPPIYLD